MNNHRPTGHDDVGSHSTPLPRDLITLRGVIRISFVFGRKGGVKPLK